MSRTDTEQEGRLRELGLLSIVVPCYNEEDVITETHKRVVNILSGIENLDFEIILVDDGSSTYAAGIGA